MMTSKANSNARRNSDQEKRHEFRLHKGEFVGLVESCGERYRFVVRDLRRESPTIQGTGTSFHSAVNAVTQLLDALAGGRAA